MERWQRMREREGEAPSDDLPFILAADGPHGPVVHAVNRLARESGISPAARVVDMRAICPDLQVAWADTGGDRAALERLVLWSRRWCPWTAADGDDGLVLDVTGAAHLFGGEEGLLADIQTQLSGLGLTTRLAAAPTWGAAWALARFGPGAVICGADEVMAQLAPLPVAGLRLEGEVLLLLRRLGLKTIGTLAEAPRLALARRFQRARPEANPLLRLDQATGRLAEPVSSREAEQRFRVQSRLAEPILDPEPWLPALCDELCALLEQAGKGCRRLHLGVFRTDGEVSRISVATSITSRNAAHFLRLFEGKLERLNPGFGFDLILLEADAVETMRNRQGDLAGGGDEGRHLAEFIDRLTAKFGTHALTRPVARESHLPERAEIWLPAMAEAEEEALPPRPDRPIRLLDHPEEIRVLYAVPEGPPAQFLWRRRLHRVARHAGPERIAPEWWRDRPGTRLRDYYRVEDEDGHRLWLYREGLHEDGRGGDPRWFVHGIFA